MTKTQAQQLGREAFEAGQINSPFASAAMMAELEGAAVGSKTHLMKAFNQGWTAANLAN